MAIAERELLAPTKNRLYETLARMDAALTIPALSISLKLADVYRRVVFESAEEL